MLEPSGRKVNGYGVVYEVQRIGKWIEVNEVGMGYVLETEDE